jgi:death on curing protein
VYASAINSNLPFLDGNKPVDFHCLLMFLLINGFVLNAQPSEATEVMLGLAAGRLKEAVVQAWIRTRLLLELN